MSSSGLGDGLRKWTIQWRLLSLFCRYDEEEEEVDSLLNHGSRNSNSTSSFEMVKKRGASRTVGNRPRTGHTDLLLVSENSSAYESSEDTGVGGLSESEMIGERVGGMFPGLQSLTLFIFSAALQKRLASISWRIPSSIMCWRIYWQVRGRSVVGRPKVDCCRSSRWMALLFTPRTIIIFVFLLQRKKN